MDICVLDSDWLEKITESRKEISVFTSEKHMIWIKIININQLQNSEQYNYLKMDKSKSKQNQKEGLKKTG